MIDLNLYYSLLWWNSSVFGQWAPLQVGSWIFFLHLSFWLLACFNEKLLHAHFAYFLPDLVSAISPSSHGSFSFSHLFLFCLNSHVRTAVSFNRMNLGNVIFYYCTSLTLKKRVIVIESSKKLQIIRGSCHVTAVWKIGEKKREMIGQVQFSVCIH